MSGKGWTRVYCWHQRLRGVDLRRVSTYILSWLFFKLAHSQFTLRSKTVLPHPSWGSKTSWTLLTRSHPRTALWLVLGSGWQERTERSEAKPVLSVHTQTHGCLVPLRNTFPGNSISFTRISKQLHTQITHNTWQNRKPYALLGDQKWDFLKRISTLTHRSRRQCYTSWSSWYCTLAFQSCQKTGIWPKQKMNKMHVKTQ